MMKAHLITVASQNFFKQFSRLNEFRDSEYLTDVTLVVGGLGDTYRAHKLVLSCHSQVFEAMFKNNMLESQRGEVIIDDVNPNIFSKYLDYIYTGDLNKNMNILDITELLMCADKYQTTTLLCALDEALERKITPYNALELHQIADTFNRETLKKISCNVMWSNMAKTMTTESWKTLIPKNRPLMNELLVNFHKKSLKKPILSSVWSMKDDVLRFAQSWKFDKGAIAFRPKGVNLSMKGKPINFVVVFTRLSTGSAVSLYPSSALPGRIMMHCKVTVYRDGFREINLEIQEHFLEWQQAHAHPTLGHRRVEIMRWSWWDPEHTWVDLEINASYGYARNATVKPWTIDQTPSQSLLSAELSLETKESDSVALCYGDKRVLIARTALKNSGEPKIKSFWAGRTEFHLPLTSDATVETVVKYINSGLFPPREKVDLQLLKVTSALQLWNLLIYVEHTLTWELDPSNVVEIAKFSHNHGPNLLVWACAQYIKLHLDRIALWDDEWKEFHHEYFDILCSEMRDEMYPCLLPQLLAQLHATERT